MEHPRRYALLLCSVVLASMVFSDAAARRSDSSAPLDAGAQLVRLDDAAGSFALVLAANADLYNLPRDIRRVVVLVEESRCSTAHSTGRRDPELSLEVDDPDLEEKALHVLRHLVNQEEEIRRGIRHVVPQQIQMMGEMGMELLTEVQRVYPNFPIPEHGKSWEAYLPPLSDELQRLVERAA